MEYTNYTFKEICKKTGYSSSAIRYYEKEFNLAIPRDGNGRRLFSKVEFDKLLFIKELQKQNYTNGQIKKILNNGNITDPNLTALDEIAAAKDAYSISFHSSNTNKSDGGAVIKFIENKFNEINNSLTELSQNINGKERDLLISENMKLKMELKRKSYEVIELKENLRFYKEKKRGIISKLFRKKSY